MAALIPALGVAQGALNTLDWRTASGFRYAELPVPKSGKTGFTLMPASITGITFTNHLSDAAVANNRIMENGSGVALGDVGGDGWCDIYFCQLEGPNLLYRNLGNWKFDDITKTAGVTCDGQMSTGAVFADIDGDGDLDLLVNSIGGGTRLFFNDGRGHFTETNNSGLVRKFGSTSMALADIDGDGDLDLYVTNYRTTNYKDAPPGVKAEAKIVNGEVVVTPADRFSALVTRRVGGVTLVEKGEPDFLYLNDGKGHFSPVSWTGGAFLDEDGKVLREPPREWGLSVMFRDINGDGAPDIYVCNDFFFSRDRTWINDGAGHFRAIARLALRNMSLSSMAVDFADINRDGYDDFFVADMLSRDHQSRQRQRANILKGEIALPINDIEYRPEVLRNTLFLNRGDGTYAEIAQLSGVQASEWSWSAVFLDVDLDGYEDLLITTGNDHDVTDADMLRQIASEGPDGSLQTHLRNLLRFPRLETPKLAFRNRGDLTFEEVGAAWGFSAAGISHGMALADLDNDGGLDLVVNNLNAAAGIYRNETGAPRLAVRLKGKTPNTQGIGARIKVVGGPMPQSQEIICGGRYLSGDDPMRVFATGTSTNEMRIEVRWRSGKRSLVSDVKPNHLYEIDESRAGEAGASERQSMKREASATRSDAPRSDAPTLPRSHTPPLFEDVSALIGHIHHDDPFDDFERQPLLPKLLSRLGPGITWFDVDGDGWDDLIIGSGRGGQMAVYHNDGRGSFQRLQNPSLTQAVTRDQTTILGWNKEDGQRLLLAGASNYEDGLTNGASLRIVDLKNGSTTDGWHGQFASVGALALADVDGDGDLDLFAGGRVVPGRYPEPAPSRLYRNEGGRFRLDLENNKRLAGAGLVSGAVFSDLDGDGNADLVLACEWGPIRVFYNRAGMFTEVTGSLGLASYPGWWNGVTVGDFDSDGKLDIIASNWGRNTKYQTYLEDSVRVYYGDFNGNGRIDLVEAYYDRGLKKVVPWRDLETMVKAMPFLGEKFSTFRAYGEASVQEILGERLRLASELRAATLDSMVFLNRGERFEARPLPVEAQFAPSFGVAVGDYDGDGNEDLFLSQNFFGVETEASRYDGGRGLWIRGDGRGGFSAVSGQESGVAAYGEGRGCALCDFDGDGRVDLAVAQNSAAIKLYRNQTGLVGLRVRMEGPVGNPQGIGAVLRLKSGERFGPAREIHAGSGYWSQDSAVQVMASPAAPAQIWARWPGGKTVTADIPAGAREISVGFDGQVKSIR